MSVILRHKQLPLIVVYSDPKESWDNAKKRLMEEIKKNGFDNFVAEASVPPLFHKLFIPVAEEDKKNDVRQKHTDSLDRLHEEEGTSSVEEGEEYEEYGGD